MELEQKIVAYQLERAFLLKQNHNLKLAVGGLILYSLYQRDKARRDGR